MAQGSVWRCRKCRYLNLDVASCQKCGEPIPERMAKALEDQEKSVRWRWESDPLERHQEDYTAPPYQPPPAPAPAGTALPGSPFSRPPVLPPNELPPWEQPNLATAPAGVATVTATTPPAPGATRRAVRFAAAVILAVLAEQVVGTVIGANRHLDASGQLKLSLGLGIAFYGLLAVWVTLRAYELDVRVRWLVGSPVRAVLTGAASAVVAAVGLVLLISAAAGHPIVDPSVALISEQPAPRLVLGILVIGLIGPFVEELIFRGFLAEAFRRKGIAVALLVSGVAFAFAHWRFAALFYYVLMGIAFGLIYFRRGLVGSFAAHATFNSSLVALALLLSHGSAVTYSVDGVAIRLPGRWHQVQVLKSDFAALGPNGSEVSFTHFNLPPTVNIDLGRIAAALQSGQVTLPGLSLDSSSVRVTQTPVGTALRLRMTVYNHPDDGALLVEGSRLIGVDFFASGSDQARQDFDSALQSLHYAGLP
jgi:membrane protease YdiL (CAAX protease family)